MTIVSAKRAIRAEVLARRAAVPAALRRALALRLADAGSILAGAAPADAVVSAYNPIRHEADTAPLLERLAQAGIATALPLTLGRDKPLHFRLWRPGDPLASGSWRIPEPLPSAPLADPDVLFVPLAAFDRRGFRLGYGAGFYDNALARLRDRKPVMAIGVAYALQEVGEVPREPHDQRLDAVITEVETLMFGLE